MRNLFIIMFVKEVWPFGNYFTRSEFHLRYGQRVVVSQHHLIYASGYTAIMKLLSQDNFYRHGKGCMAASQFKTNNQK